MWWGGSGGGGDSVIGGGRCCLGVHVGVFVGDFFRRPPLVFGSISVVATSCLKFLGCLRCMSFELRFFPC